MKKVIPDEALKESAEVAGNYLDDSIKIADKYKIDREDFVHETLSMLIMTSYILDYDKYKEKGEQKNEGNK